MAALDRTDRNYVSPSTYQPSQVPSIVLRVMMVAAAILSALAVALYLTGFGITIAGCVAGGAAVLFMIQALGSYLLERKLNQQLVLEAQKPLPAPIVQEVIVYKDKPPEVLHADDKPEDERTTVEMANDILRQLEELGSQKDHFQATALETAAELSKVRESLSRAESLNESFLERCNVLEEEIRKDRETIQKLESTIALKEKELTKNISSEALKDEIEILKKQKESLEQQARKDSEALKQFKASLDLDVNNHRAVLAALRLENDELKETIKIYQETHELSAISQSRTLEETLKTDDKQSTEQILKDLGNLVMLLDSCDGAGDQVRLDPDMMLLMQDEEAPEDLTSIVEHLSKVINAAHQKAEKIIERKIDEETLLGWLLEIRRVFNLAKAWMGNTNLDVDAHKEQILQNMRALTKVIKTLQEKQAALSQIPSTVTMPKMDSPTALEITGTPPVMRAEAPPGPPPAPLAIPAPIVGGPPPPPPPGIPAGAGSPPPPPALPKAPTAGGAKNFAGRAQEGLERESKKHAAAKTNLDATIKAFNQLKLKIEEMRDLAEYQALQKGLEKEEVRFQIELTKTQSLKDARELALQNLNNEIPVSLGDETYTTSEDKQGLIDSVTDELLQQLDIENASFQKEQIAPMKEKLFQIREKHINGLESDLANLDQVEEIFKAFADTRNQLIKLVNKKRYESLSAQEKEAVDAKFSAYITKIQKWPVQKQALEKKMSEYQKEVNDTAELMKKYTAAASKGKSDAPVTKKANEAKQGGNLFADITKGGASKVKKGITLFIGDRVGFKTVSKPQETKTSDTSELTKALSGANAAVEALNRLRKGHEEQQENNDEW